MRVMNDNEKWKQRLGSSVDGFVFRVGLNGRIFALKVIRFLPLSY